MAANVDDTFKQWLTPDRVDWFAKEEPEKTFAFLPRGARLEDGFCSLSHAAVAKAVDALSWWLDDRLANLPPRCTISYIGPDDFRYVLMFFAACKTRRPLLVPMLYNTHEAMAGLLKSSSCEAVFGTKTHEHYWDVPRKSLPDLQYIELPSIDAFINDQPVTPYTYDRPYPEILDEVAAIGQSSGTTGTPKQLPFLHRTLGWPQIFIAEDDEDDPLVQNICWQDAVCPIIMSMSWMAGLLTTADLPLLHNFTAILLPPDAPKPLTPEYLHRFNLVAPKNEPKNVLYTTPDVITRQTQNPDHLKALADRYEWIAYSGAPLAQEVGDLLTSHGIRVQSLIGNTEVAMSYPLLYNPDKKDWNFHRFHPTLGGFHFQPFLESDNLYELCINRMTGIDPRPVFRANPEMQVYHTRDLWRPVPSREGFWQGAGRADDFIKLSNMTKFNAADLEKKLERHPTVVKAMVDGAGRKKVFAILEVKGDQNERGWLGKLLEEVNQGVHPDAWIEEGMVLFTKPVGEGGKGIQRTSKGTINRRGTLALFGEEIEGLYRGLE